MTDDLVDSLEKFRLTEEEEVVIDEKVQASDDNGSKTKITLMMVGKLLTERPFNFEAMKRTVRSVWRLNDEIVVRMVKSNVFVFQFTSIADKNKVIEGSPWFFDSQLLLLKEINGEEQITEVSFKHSPCWIRIYDVPFAKRNLTVDKEIGNCMGRLLEFDESDPLGLEHFIRVKVLIDINKPLRRGLKIATNKNESKWVDIKYERLGDFCYYCGRLGHIDRDCTFNNGEEENSKQMVYRYGPWMRASPIKRNRNAWGEYEKERRLMDKIGSLKESGVIAHNDSTIIKFGPPSMARKVLFHERKDTSPVDPPSSEYPSSCIKLQDERNPTVNALGSPQHSTYQSKEATQKEVSNAGIGDKETERQKTSSDDMAKKAKRRRIHRTTKPVA